MPDGAAGTRKTGRRSRPCSRGWSRVSVQDRFGGPTKRLERITHRVTLRARAGVAAGMRFRRNGAGVPDRQRSRPRRDRALSGLPHAGGQAMRATNGADAGRAGARRYAQGRTGWPTRVEERHLPDAPGETTTEIRRLRDGERRTGPCQRRLNAKRPVFATLASSAALTGYLNGAKIFDHAPAM